jgi:hypothetical protein
VTDAFSARIDLGDFSYSTDDAGCVVAVAGKVKTNAVVAKDSSDVSLSQV